MDTDPRRPPSEVPTTHPPRVAVTDQDPTSTFANVPTNPGVSVVTDVASCALCGSPTTDRRAHGDQIEVTMTHPRPAVDLDLTAVGAHFGQLGPWAIASGERVRERRRLLGIRAATLAHYCGIGVPTLYKVETGVMVPSHKVMVAIAFHLGTSPAELWTYPANDELRAALGGGRE